MKLRNAIAVMLVTVLCATALVGCTPAATGAPTDTGGEDRVITVGFSQIGAEADWRVGHTNSIMRALEGEGHQVIFNDAQGQQQNQIQAIRDFITQGVDYIVMAPVVATGWDPVMREVRESGIPFILVDRPIEMPNVEDYVVQLITNDVVSEGVRAAEWLIDYLEYRGRSGENINIVELQGSVGTTPAIGRAEGFRRGIADHPNLQITQSQTAEWSADLGLVVMEAFLARAHAENEPIHVVYSHSDGQTMGAIQAIRDAGLNPGVDIIVVSNDGGRAAFEVIMAGDMNVTVEASPDQGPLVAQTIRDLEAGRTVERLLMDEVRVFDEVLSGVFPDRYLNTTEHIDGRVF